MLTRAASPAAAPRSASLATGSSSADPAPAACAPPSAPGSAGPAGASDSPSGPAASDSIVFAATCAIALLLVDLDLAGPGFGVPACCPLRPCEWGISVRSVETMMPRPLQCSHGTENAASNPEPTRFLVIWTRPSEVTSATWCLVRSRARHSIIRRSTRSRLLSSTMSMKSMTMMPPMSLSLSCRTISSAASRLFLVTVCSRLPPWPVNLPVFTSMTVIASVVSITSEPPLGSQTFLSSALAICSSIR